MQYSNTCEVMVHPLQVYCWPEGTYEGEVASGRRHGQGVMRLAGSEAVYEGAWEHGQRQGQGVLNFNSNRTAYYEGERMVQQVLLRHPPPHTHTFQWPGGRRTPDHHAFAQQQAPAV
jgi:hypothetical protein